MTASPRLRWIVPAMAKLVDDMRREQAWSFRVNQQRLRKDAAVLLQKHQQIVARKAARRAIAVPG